MTEKFDVAILGAGPAGEVALNTLLEGRASGSRSSSRS